MSIKRINEFPEGSGNLTNDDIFLFMDNPAGSGVTKKISVSQIGQAIAAGVNLQFRRGTEAQRVQITPLQGEPIYTTDSKKLYIGDGDTVGGNEIISGTGTTSSSRQNPPGMVRMVTVLSSTPFNAFAKSSTGYIAVRWWDGSVDIFGSGQPTSLITFSKNIPTTGSWSKSSPKEIFLWSCTLNNANQSGNLTHLECYSRSIVSLDVKGLTSLQHINCQQNPLGSLDVGGLTSLTTLNATNAQLTSLNIIGCPLTQLLAGQNLLTSLDLSGQSTLTMLQCWSNLLTSLNISHLTSLATLMCNNNQLTSLDISGLTSLEDLNCSYNILTSIRAVGVSTPGSRGGSGYYYYYGGSQIKNNNLSAQALDQFYTDLAAANGGMILVSNNPGTAGDNPTIATSKGYTVYGS